MAANPRVKLGPKDRVEDCDKKILPGENLRDALIFSPATREAIAQSQESSLERSIRQGINDALVSRFPRVRSGDFLGVTTAFRTENVERVCRQSKPKRVCDFIPSRVREAVAPEAENPNCRSSRAGSLKGKQTSLARVGGVDNCNNANPAKNVNANTFKVSPRAEFKSFVNGGGDFIPENSLNGFINLQYHIVFSALPASVIPKMQRILPLAPTTRKGEGNIDELLRNIKRENESAVVIASTGDVFRNETARTIESPEEQFATLEANLESTEPIEALDRDFSGRNYFNIQSLEIQNIMAPMPGSPFQSFLTTAKMTLVEPHGFDFPENIRTIADQIGYRGIHWNRMIYRLDVFFSGYNTNTGEWDSQIDLSSAIGQSINKISYYFMIAQMPAKLEHTGTTYEIGLVPYGHIAWRPEEVIVDAGAVFSDKDITFGKFLDKLQESLETAKDERTQGNQKRKYRFYAPDQLRQATFYSQEFANKHGFIGEGPEDGNVVTTGSGIEVMSVLEAAMKDLELVWNSFLNTEDEGYKEPRIHWGIRFNVIYDNNVRANPNINDLDEITLEYIIEPFATYKKATITDKKSAEKITAAAAQAARIQRMAELGMINRIYDYIHTAENTEVMDFNVNFQAFYYHLLTTQVDSAAFAGDMTQSAPANVDIKRANVFIDNVSIGTIGKQSASTQERIEADSRVIRQKRAVIDSTLQSIFGRGIDNPEPFCQAIGRTPDVFTILGGGFNDSPRTSYFGSGGSDAQELRNKYQLNLDDYLRNDLLSLESLKVRGDPIWLLSPYASASVDTIEDPTLNSVSGNVQGRPGIVRGQAGRYIFLRFFAPRQDDMMNPNRQSATTSCSILGGFYEVYSVTSVFEGGKFTQTITGGKANHLNYAESLITMDDVTSAVSPAAESESAQTQNCTRKVPNNAGNVTPTSGIDEFNTKGQLGLAEIQAGFAAVPLPGDRIIGRVTSEDEGQG